MKHHLRWGLLLVLMLMLISACGPRPPSEDEGVYTTAHEVFFFQSEVLELKRGRFRYWMQSDVVPINPPKLPITGKYRREGDRILLEMKPAMEKTLLLVKVSGATCLVREDSVPIWQAPRREVYPYGWIIRVPHTAEEMWPGEGFEEKQLNTLIPRLPTLKSLRLKIHGSTPRTPSPVRPDGTLDPALQKALENLPK